MIAIVAIQAFIIAALAYYVYCQRQWYAYEQGKPAGQAPRRRKAPRRFVVERTVDVSGVSGRGTVVEGVVFSDGYGASHFLNQTPQKEPSTTVWHLPWYRRVGPDPVTKIHGHDGASKVVWLDE